MCKITTNCHSWEHLRFCFPALLSVWLKQNTIKLSYSLGCFLGHNKTKGEIPDRQRKTKSAFTWQSQPTQDHLGNSVSGTSTGPLCPHRLPASHWVENPLRCVRVEKGKGQEKWWLILISAF